MVVLKIENITYYTATYVKGFTEAKKSSLLEVK